jgi:antitoxin component of MazEF toxin-antitoxin module
MRYNEYMHAITQVRRAGNSVVIRLSREELEREGIAVDDYVSVDVHAITITPRVPADLREAFEAEVARGDRAFALLVDG